MGGKKKKHFFKARDLEKKEQCGKAAENSPTEENVTMQDRGPGKLGKHEVSRSQFGMSDHLRCVAGWLANQGVHPIRRLNFLGFKVCWLPDQLEFSAGWSVWVVWGYGVSEFPSHKKKRSREEAGLASHKRMLFWSQL